MIGEFEKLQVKNIAMIDGKEVEYDVCSQNDNAYGDKFTCIGKFVIYSVDGIVQSMSDRELYFYVKIQP